MTAIYLFSYSDSVTEPAEFWELIEYIKDSPHAPSEEKIQKLNDLRSRLASLLASQPNTKPILTVINDYIPELISILPYIEHNKLQNKIKFKWRSSLSASVRVSLYGNFEKPMIKSYSIYFEIIYVQMVYAYILSNMAIKKVSSNTSDENLNLAINDLCRAAGIFQNLSVSYASTWAIQDGPPETTSDSLIALAELALGDAQQLACLKAEKKNMSSGIIFKLRSAIISKYDKCQKHITINKDDYEDFSLHFKSHVNHVLKFIEAELLISMAKDHAEKEEYGTAVAKITAAHNLLLECDDAENSNIKIQSKELLSESDFLHSKYTKYNNSVTYQKIPTYEDLRIDYLSSCKVIVDPKPVTFGSK